MPETLKEVHDRLKALEDHVDALQQVIANFLGIEEPPDEPHPEHCLCDWCFDDKGKQ